MKQKKATFHKPVGPKSDALKSFEGNLDQIFAFLQPMKGSELLRVGKKLERIIAQEAASKPKINVKRIERSVLGLARATDKWLAFYGPRNMWMTVMLVSFVEAYLEDGLIGIAVKKPQVVKSTNINWARPFEVDSIEELRSELRRNWAHDSLRPDGPITWHRKLRDLGAPKFDSQVLDNLRHLWDTRNLIVHSRCIADPAYAKRYAHLGARTGVKVAVNLKVFGEWLAAVKGLVQWADTFFLAYGSTAEKAASQASQA